MRKCYDDEYKKIKNLCVKNLTANNIKSKNIDSETGSFSTLSTNDLNVRNINGVNINCFNSNTLNTSGIITPVVYKDGEPQQPDNDGTFNQKVLDDLWFLNRLAGAVTNLDSSYGRLRSVILNNFYGCNICPSEDISNCPCPVPVYAVFQGSIIGNLLTVTEIKNVSLTDCPPVEGTIKISQQIYGKSKQFLESIIVSQSSGTTGGVGTYIIQNKFDDSLNIPLQEMLSLSVTGTEECANVPLRIYGVETLSVGPINDCNTLLSNISYNINIANRTLGSKLAAIYVQVGWQNLGSEEVQIQGLEIDTRQFDNSILSFGEQMNKTILLPTELILKISPNNFSDTVNAVSQIVVYVEDGLNVFIPTNNISNNVSSRNIKPFNTTSETNFSTTLSTSNIPIVTIETYKIPTGSTSVKLKGGGGGAYSQIYNSEFFGTPVGGGGEGYIIIEKIPEGAISFKIISIGEGGFSAKEDDIPTDGKSTEGCFLNLDGLKIGNNIIAKGGKAGKNEGGDGYSGGGGNAIPTLGGKGISPELNGKDGISPYGGNGGNNGGKGGKTKSRFIGGGGGGGFDITTIGTSAPANDGGPPLESLEIVINKKFGLGTGAGGNNYPDVGGINGYVQFI